MDPHIAANQLLADSTDYTVSQMEQETARERNMCSQPPLTLCRPVVSTSSRTGKRVRLDSGNYSGSDGLM